MRQSAFFLIVLLIFGSILFLFNLGGWDLWNPDEPRYAQIAKEMSSRNNWLVPYLNSALYCEKPPLFFALVAASAKLWGGMNAFSARFPSAIFAVLTVILTFSLGKRLLNERVGLFGALILATSAEFLWLSHRAKMDIPLTFFTTAAIILFYEGFYRQKGRWICYLLAHCSMAVGVLIKLHVAVIVPLLVIGGYFLVRREFRFFRDSSHLPGIGFFLTIVGGWIVLTHLAGGEDYLAGLLYRRTTSRFFLGPSHQRPIYYYLVRFPADFLPWTIFFPSALIYGLSAKGRRQEFLFCVFWFLTIFVAFSLVKGKREPYLLPLYPAAALMVAYLWDELARGSQVTETRLIAVPFLILMIFAGLVAVSIPIAAAVKGPSYFEHALEMGLVGGFILGGGGLLCFLAFRSGRQILPLYLVVSIIFVFSLYTRIRVFPEINRYKSARPLSEAIVGSMKPGDQLGVYRLQGSEYNYYTGIDRITRIETPEALKNFLQSPKRVFCIMRDRHYDRLRIDATFRARVILTGSVGHRQLVVVSNQEADQGSR